MSAAEALRKERASPPRADILGAAELLATLACDSFCDATLSQSSTDGVPSVTAVPASLGLQPYVQLWPPVPACCQETGALWLGRCGIVACLHATDLSVKLSVEDRIPSGPWVGQHA